jgi:hypothetical protein
MGWTLASSVGFCEVGGEPVFLDLSRDRYFGLSGEDRAAFERLRAGEQNDSAAMTRLVATGLLRRCDGLTTIEPASTDVPDRDLSAASDGSFSLRMAASAALALRRARRAMRPDRIGETIAKARRQRAAIDTQHLERDAEAVAVAYAANRWIDAIPQRCLIDALALDHILLSRRLRSQLVFGVRLSPFRAHCWLQTSATVLTGTAAEARNFTPILVVT